MKERAITEEEIAQTLESPEKVATQGDATSVAMKVRKNKHLLIVIYRREESQYHVITVIDTSKVNKYL